MVEKTTGEGIVGDLANKTAAVAIDSVEYSDLEHQHGVVQRCQVLQPQGRKRARPVRRQRVDAHRLRADVIIQRWEEFTGQKAELEGADESAHADAGGGTG